LTGSARVTLKKKPENRAFCAHFSLHRLSAYLIMKNEPRKRASVPKSMDGVQWACRFDALRI
jgi:hypothetical protein